MSTFPFSGINADHKQLMEQVHTDIMLICSSASSHSRLLEGNPELMDSEYQKTLTSCMEELQEVRNKLKQQQQVLQESGEIGLEERFRIIEERSFSPGNDDRSEREILKKIFAKRKSSASGSSWWNPFRTQDDTTSVVRQEVSSTDPLTKLPIQIPVKNGRCGHKYCYSTILQYIRSKHYPPCPIGGCSLPHIREDDLIFE